MVPVPLVRDDVLLVVRVPVVELPRVLVPRVLVPWVLLPDVELLVVVLLGESVIILSLSSCKEMVVKRPLREVVLGLISRSFILPGVVGLVLVPVGVLVVVPEFVELPLDGVFEGVVPEFSASKIDGRRDEEPLPADLRVELACSGPLTRTK